MPITNEIGAVNFTMRISERDAEGYAASTVTRGKMKSSYWKLNYFSKENQVEKNYRVGVTPNLIDRTETAIN